MTQPSSQYVTEGTTATLLVAAAGSPPLSYQWSFDGTNIAGATNATLILTNIQATNTGNYSVLVSDNLGTVTSTDALLTVQTCFSSLDVAMVIDTSCYTTNLLGDGNMGILADRIAATNFLQALNFTNDQAALFSFNYNVATNQPLTNNLPDLLNAVGSVPDGVAETYPVMGNALQIAQSELAGPRDNSDALPVMIFVSGAEPTDVQGGPYEWQTDVEDTSNLVLGAATLVKASGTRLITIALGSGADTNFMALMATSPGDTYYATNLSQLTDDYNLIAASICRGTNTPAANALSVQMISPTNGQLFILSPTNILLEATAISSVGANITGVWFTNTTQGIGLGSGSEITNSTYATFWLDATNGTNTATVTARDNLGDVATNSVSIIVNAMPVVSIISPTNLQSFLEVTNVAISVTATDIYDNISNVELFAYSNTISGSYTNILLGIATTIGTNGYYNFTWTNRYAGPYSVIAVATDDRGSSASSGSVFIVNPTNGPPACEITYPTNNEAFSDGANITITAYAYATNGSGPVTNVEFFVNGNDIGGCAEPPYAITKCCWDPGIYQLTAIAADSLGRYGISSNVEITVGQEPPESEGFWDPTFVTSAAMLGLTGGDEGGEGEGPIAIGAGNTIYVAGGYDLNDAIYSSTNNGETWLGIGNTDDGVHDLLADGTNLYVAGWGVRITQNGTNIEGDILVWNGSYWATVGDPNNDPYGIVRTSSPLKLAKIDGTLYVGEYGDANGIYAFNVVSNQWLPVGNGIQGLEVPTSVYSIASLNHVLYIGGTFTGAGGDTNACFIACLMNNTWTNLGAGITPFSGTDYSGDAYSEFNCVDSLTACGSNLFVGGCFTTVGNATNAFGVALWNGDNWQSLDGGVTPSPISTGIFPEGNFPLVNSIVVHGDRVYVGGNFSSVFNGETTIPASDVAMVAWNEASQSWTWSDMDGGVYPGEAYDFAFVPGNSVTNYALYVTGAFSSVGSAQLPESYLARWRVGYTYPTNLPSVTITNPASGTTVTLGTNMTVNATAFSSVGISNVQLYATGQNPLNGSGNGSNSYTFSYGPPSIGVYQLLAVAMDNNGLVAASKPIIVDVKGPTNPVTAVDLQYSVPENSPPVNFYVLTNDLPAHGLAVGQVTEMLTGGPGLGTPSVGYAGEFITYAPTPGVYGTDMFYYTVTNAAGSNDSASVTVNIYPVPQIAITNPVYSVESVASTNGTVSLVVAGDSSETGGSVTNVSLYVNGTFFGQTSSTNFAFSWSTTSSGAFSFVAVATDQNGVTNASQPVTIITSIISDNGTGSTSTNQLVASITNLVVTYDGAGDPIYPTINTGIFDLTGKARPSPGGLSFPVAYQVILCTSDGYDTPIANLTPQPDAQGFHEGGDNSGDLGAINLSSMQNGVYDLQLNVYGGGTETNVTVRFILNSTLKVGQFTFTEQDLSLPVNGIPITVTRTYNSQNPNSADFGYGWTFNLNSLNVQLDEQRQDVVLGGPQAPYDDDSSDDGEPDTLSVRTGGGWDVTLTLPNGQVTTFNFSPELLAGFSTYYEAQWTAPPWIHATLTNLVPYSDEIQLYPSTYWQDSDMSFGNAPMQNQDFPGWILTTTPDDTKYYITRPFEDDLLYLPDPNQPLGTAQVYGPPTLTKIVEHTGDSIIINPNSIYHVNPSGSSTNGLVTITRDTQGRITSISDPNAGPNGLPLVQYIYDQDNGNLIQVLKLLDRNTGLYATNRYDYNNPNLPHYITSIEDPQGAPVTRNTYDSNGRLIQSEDTENNITRYIYGATTNFEQIVDPLGNTNTVIYDAMGNVTETVDALGHTNLSAYNQTGYLTNSTDALGNSTTYVNDQNGNILSVTVPYPAGADPAAYTTSFTYDQYGDQTSVTLPTGGIVTNIYDSYGNLTGSYDEQGNLISFAGYNSDGLPVTDGDQFGTNYYGYDSVGNMTTFTNSLGGVTTSGYDPNGNLTNFSDSNGSSTIAYDALNRQTAADYAHGMTVNYNYTENDSDWSAVSGPTIGNMQRQLDDEGRLAGWNTPNGSNPGFAYDNDGRLQFETNSIGVVDQSVYDGAGRLIATTNLATGSWAVYGYDADGRKIAETNAYGQVTTYGYWPSGSLMAMTNAAGSYWLYSDAAGACSACGNSGSVTDILGRVTVTVTSPHDLPLQTIWLAYPGASGDDAVTNSITYPQGMTTPDQDAADYPASQTDEGGQTRYYTYTSVGQLWQATDLSGTDWWTNQYDASSGDLTNVLSPMGESLGYTYDDLDNVAAMQFADGNWLTNYYDSANRLSGVRLPTGICLTNLYDFAGRLTNHSSTIGETACFSYNGNDAITVMTDNTGSTTNYYDSGGRLCGIDYPSGAGVRYALDLLDRIMAITNWPSGGGPLYVTHYQYDAIGNITNIIDPFNGQTSFTYDQVGRRTQRILPNGIVTTWQYNWQDKVTNIVHKTSDGAVLASASYIRAQGGEPLQITREDGSYVVLGYDAALRLTNEVYYNSRGVPQTTNSYGYDADGNRILFAQGGTVLTNGVLPGYQVMTIKNAANGSTMESYAYDAGGRETTITRNGDTLNFGYNSSDQVTAVTNGTSWVTYVHDAEGRRTESADSSGVVRQFLVAPTPGSDLESPHLIANGSGALQAGYVYDGDEPVLCYNSSGTANYYLEDGIGSVIGIAPATSPSTANTTRLFYDGFGNSRATNGPAPAMPAGAGGDFRFQGAWLETDSGLYNMRAREYDARTGRFTSRDPGDGNFQLPESLNEYAFANENPFVYSDPSGNFTLVDISVATDIDVSLDTLADIAISQAEQEIVSQIRSELESVIWQELQSFLPLNLSAFKNIPGQFGLTFEQAAHDFMCDAFEKAGVPNQFHFLVRVANSGKHLGDPISTGVNCAGDNPPIKGGWRNRIPTAQSWSVPDFIISSKPPLGPHGGMPPAWLVGDFKASSGTFYNQYISPGSKKPQFNAIVGYAQKHTYSRVALYIVGLNNIGSHKASNQSPQWRQIRLLLGQQLLTKGVIGLMINVLN